MTLDNITIQAIADAVVQKLAGIKPVQSEPGGVEVYQIRSAAALDLVAARARTAAKREGKSKGGQQ